MIIGGISLFGFDLFGPVRKIIEGAREEARASSEAFSQKAKGVAVGDRDNTDRDDLVALAWNSHFWY